MVTECAKCDSYVSICALLVGIERNHSADRKAFTGTECE